MIDTAQIKDTLEKETGMVFQPTLSLEDLQHALAIYINQLIVSNFEKLVFLLYRIDISEKSIQQLLQQATTATAGETIAKAIIERQLQKIELRKKYTPPANIASEEEKW
ncbi:hypothetical protein [Parasediminibacterium sp. JCM 36343]|uniref:hypothetical protein n=1 Tax=Parasediminibacterium sp. JCM 36343 TaxID=3374279 RepID=UPI00397D1524